jgi:hypothetical protein
LGVRTPDPVTVFGVLLMFGFWKTFFDFDACTGMLVLGRRKIFSPSRLVVVLCVDVPNLTLSILVALSFNTGGSVDCGAEMSASMFLRTI